MTVTARMRRVLVIAPHPDDEVLGCGGTMARLAGEGAHVAVAVLTRGRPPRFDPDQADAVRAEAERSHASLGIAETRFLDLPAAELDRIAHADLNAAIAGLLAAVRPDTLFVPFAGDLHLDHRLAFDSAMVAARPRGDAYPARILAYETLSETNWSAPHVAPAFRPTVFVDIAAHLDRKLAAFALFASQCRAFPDERSPDALRALALLRGACVTRHAAEAFMLIREVG